MNNFLVLDTSSKYLTVYAEKDGKRAVSHLENCAASHSVVLMDEVDKVLKSLSLTPEGCDFFGAVTGPGSFTGIRIGVSTVKGMALACGKPLLAITVFDMLAYNVEDENFIIAVDALHDHYYVAGYKKRGECDLSPAYLSREEIEALSRPVYGFEELPFARYTRLSVKDCLPRAVEALKGNLCADIAALYVRKSQAEEAKSGS